MNKAAAEQGLPTLSGGSGNSQSDEALMSPNDEGLPIVDASYVAGKILKPPGLGARSEPFMQAT